MPTPEQLKRLMANPTYQDAADDRKRVMLKYAGFNPDAVLSAGPAGPPSSAAAPTGWNKWVTNPVEKSLAENLDPSMIVKRFTGGKPADLAQKIANFATESTVGSPEQAAITAALIAQPEIGLSGKLAEYAPEAAEYLRTGPRLLRGAAKLAGLGANVAAPTAAGAAASALSGRSPMQGAQSGLTQGLTSRAAGPVLSAISSRGA